jgi:prolyl-tRNA synthetase
VRLEVGPRDVANAAVMSVRRDGRVKESIPLAKLGERLPALLEEIQASLFAAAHKFREESTVFVEGIDKIEAHFKDQRGMVAVPWDGNAAFEAEVKARTMATMRCVPLDQSRYRDAAGGRTWALFARSY